MSGWRYALAAWLIIAAILLAGDTPIAWALGGSAACVAVALGAHLLLEKLDDSIHRR